MSSTILSASKPPTFWSRDIAEMWSEATNLTFFHTNTTFYPMYQGFGFVSTQLVIFVISGFRKFLVIIKPTIIGCFKSGQKWHKNNNHARLPKWSLNHWCTLFSKSIHKSIRRLVPPKTETLYYVFSWNVTFFSELGVFNSHLFAKKILAVI